MHIIIIIMRNSWMVSQNRARTTKTFVAIWTIALFLAVLLVALFPTFRFFKASALSALLIVTGSGFYIRVIRFLTKSAETSAVRVASTHTILKVSFIRVSQVIFVFSGAYDICLDPR